jgi:hypothetical protein
VTPDPRLVLDAGLAEHLGAGSILWGRASADAGDDFASRFCAARSHIERMASLEDGRSLCKVRLAHGYDELRKAAGAAPNVPMIVRAPPIEYRLRRLGSSPVEGARWIVVAHPNPGRRCPGIFGEVAGSTGPTKLI